MSKSEQPTSGVENFERTKQHNNPVLGKRIKDDPQTLDYCE